MKLFAFLLRALITGIRPFLGNVLCRYEFTCTAHADELLKTYPFTAHFLSLYGAFLPATQLQSFWMKSGARP